MCAHQEKKSHLVTVWCRFCGRPAKADVETGEISPGLWSKDDKEGSPYVTVCADLATALPSGQRQYSQATRLRS